MSVEKFSVSFDPDLGRQIREFADADDLTVSAFLAEAARERVRQLTLDRWLAEAATELGMSRAELEQMGRTILDEPVVATTPRRRARPAA